MGDNGLPLSPIHPAMTPKAYCPLSIFHFLETLMIKLQCTDGRRKAQRGQATCPRPHRIEIGLVLRSAEAPISLPAQASSLLLLSHVLVSHQADSHSIQPQGPGLDLTKPVMVQRNPGAKQPRHSEHLLHNRHVHATSFSQQGSRASSPMDMGTRGSGR